MFSKFAQYYFKQIDFRIEIRLKEFKDCRHEVVSWGGGGGGVNCFLSAGINFINTPLPVDFMIILLA